MKEENLDLWMERNKDSTCIKEAEWSTNFSYLGIFLDLDIVSWRRSILFSINMAKTIEFSEGFPVLNLQYL